jgi:hypothetical protein
MWNWLVGQYNDIRGNFKWALLVALWWLVATYGKRMLQLIPNIPGWLVTSILLCLSLAVFLWVAKSAKASPSSQIQSSVPAPSPQSLQQRSTSFPSLSALHGQAPQITFNAYEWFRHAYYSPLTAEIENNIKIIAHNNQPNDHEGFYARFIGVGLISYTHDMTWAYIFKSQLLMLADVNRRNGNLPLSDAKTYYDKAASEYPKIYENYSFQQWMDYMYSQQLLIRHPSDMLEITYRGNDLLKYLAHWGRDANVKAG